MRTAVNVKILGTYFSAEWRQLANAWPMAVIGLGVIMSFAWTILAIWFVLGLLDLAM